MICSLLVYFFILLLHTYLPQGIQIWPDGSRYEGTFLNDTKHGIGFHLWANGEVRLVCFLQMEWQHYPFEHLNKIMNTFFLYYKELPIMFEALLFTAGFQFVNIDANT